MPVVHEQKYFLGNIYEDFFQITNLMHNSFILQQYVCYIRSSTCFEQHLAHPQEDKLYHQSLWYRHSL